jgi:glycosyltransferase involved in cell wall biosynthesis
MRVGIDYSIAVRRGAGITRYTRELVDALVALHDDTEYVLLWPGLDADPAEIQRSLPHGPNVRSVRLPLTSRALTILWHRLRVPLWADALAGGVDVFHAPDFVLAPLLRASGVVTIHDLSFLRFPEFTDAGLLAYLRRIVPSSVHRARVVLADSEATRQDVIELLHADPQLVEVVYAGVHDRFQPVRDPHELEVVRARYDLPPQFILALGTVQPRKNLARLMDAVSTLPSHRDVALIVVGQLGWLFDGIITRVQQLGLGKRVRFVGFVPDQDVPALYSLATCFAFPSLYEGFGLPPLEAMACGVPVVSSSVSSMPEVLGDAALLVDPYDVDALSHALQRVLDDSHLRRQMIERGFRRAQQFSWSASALKLESAYRRAQAG